MLEKASTLHLKDFPVKWVFCVACELPSAGNASLTPCQGHTMAIYVHQVAKYRARTHFIFNLCFISQFEEL